MHILLLHQIFVTPDEGGGTRHYEFSKYLVEMGHKVTVIASEIDYFSGHAKGKKFEILDGIEVHYIKTRSSHNKSIIQKGLSFIIFAFNSFRVLLKIKDVDVLYTTSPPLFQVFTGWLAARIKKIPIIFEVRDLWLDFAKELGVITNPLVLFIFKRLERFLYRNADFLMANSPGFIPYIKNAAKRQNVAMFPNGVSVSDFENSQPCIENIDGKFFVLYSGNIGVANDISTIISAAKYLEKYQDIEIQLMGGGMKKRDYKTQCEIDQIKNIKFLDPIPKSQLADKFGKTHICIATLKNIPLFTTNYPNKVFDYMAAAKPIVLGIKGVTQEIVKKADAGVCIEPGDPEQLANAILYYYKDRLKIVDHGLKGRAYVQKHFDRKQITRDFEKYLCSIKEKSIDKFN